MKSSDYVTKEYLDTRLEKLKKELREEVIFSQQETVKQLEETILGVKDILLSAIDSSTKELEESREDRTIAASQTRELRDAISNHEKRISTLEKKYRKN